ncbi:Glycosyl transferase, family 2 [Rubellimicrobium mesophilum DSM 19309]|uniref:Glycosyl transferase, family 2 n=1 Tax=Rubellimicrobium mesophilum DSM 19309 TaxID=442562 RepID=A0A017HKT3_9RHOB|nr:glycosyltransferase family 2 protein [Rubellimicrobium mesophilum]EYD75072.1 Glycosyl transferase, family 2 [Rubellimicrobium mesophilum DSM 19309]
MLISIVTAVWNRADTVAEAVRSLHAQDWSEWEHVVQDGGSTDGTLGVLQGLADDRTRLVSERDAGLYDAINRGLARTTGDVVGLLHSDDLYAAPDILSSVAKAFEDPEVDAVYGDLLYVSRADTSKVIRTWRSQPFRPALLRRGWMPPHPTLFLRRRVLDRLGAFDTSYRIAADYDAVLRYFGQPGFRAVHLPKTFVHMRVGGESNRSLGRILRKSREDFRALRRNGVGGLPTLVAKNASKIGQFF